VKSGLPLQDDVEYQNDAFHAELTAVEAHDTCADTTGTGANCPHCRAVNVSAPAPVPLQYLLLGKTVTLSFCCGAGVVVVVTDPVVGAVVGLEPDVDVPLVVDPELDVVAPLVVVDAEPLVVALGVHVHTLLASKLTVPPFGQQYPIALLPLHTEPDEHGGLVGAGVGAGVIGAGLQAVPLYT
jgi:hypothetical protein